MYSRSACVLSLLNVKSSETPYSVAFPYTEEVRTKTAFFMHQSSILVAWINDGKPSFLLWLRLRRLVVLGEGIWGCSPRNSAMDFFWVVKLLDCTMGSCGEFSFKYCSMALCTSLRDSSPLVSVSFCDFSVELYTRDLVKFLWRRLFQDIFKFSRWLDRE